MDTAQRLSTTVSASLVQFRPIQGLLA
jgi:hypothetical protein